MRRKRSLIGFSVFFASIACLLGCSTLHIHDQDSPWAHSETEHWQVCTRCGKEFNKEAHSFNEYNNTCGICSYHDPIFHINEQGIMTSLTPFGKTKSRIDAEWGDEEFRKVVLIGDHAFKDSKAQRVIVPKETIGYKKNAFEGTAITGDPETEELVTEWNDYGDYRYKENLVEKNAVEANGVFYKTLQEALDATKEDDDVTIVLLKDLQYDKKTPIKISNKVTLSTSSITSKYTLDCNFEIETAGILTILANRITYTGTTYLTVGQLQEVHGKDQHECYSTGSLVFNGIDEEPDPNHVFVFYNHVDGKTYKAAGAKQVTTEILILKSNNFAYGTFRFSKDFKQIMGLTEFGQTVTNLTIHSVLYDPIDTSIVNSCFVKYGEEKITIKILWSKKEIKVSGNFQKGSFKVVNIGKKIVSIGNDAFSTAFESSHMDQTLREAVSLVVCPLVTLSLGDDVKEIKAGAFRYCGSLGRVFGGKSLERIEWAAFADCYQLTEVNFSTASNFQYISNSAFGACNRLQYADLPKENWVMDGRDSYPVTECTPANFAFWLKTRHVGQHWNRNVSNQGCYTFNPNTKDQDGRHNGTRYFNNLQEAINNSGNDSVIHITKNYKNPKEIENIEVKHTVRIIADEDVEVAIKNISVNNYCCAIFNGKVNITGNVVLSKTNKNDGQGGIAVENNVGSIEDENVVTRVNKTGEPPYKSVKFNCKIPDILDSSIEKEYIGYGACDFSCNTSTNEESLIRLSNLGFRCSSIELKEQSADTNKVTIVNNFGTNNDGRNNLKNIDFGDNIQYVKTDAFKKCNQLEKVTCGKGLIELGQGAFYESHSLTTVDLSKCAVLEKIGNGCFKDCNVQTIDANSISLNYIGQNAFLNNPLNSFYFHKDNLKNWKFIPTKGTPIPISEEEIKEGVDAAKLLTGKYCGTGNWQR